MHVRGVGHSTLCLTLQQAHEEAGQGHGEDRLRAEVGQDGGEGCHRPPGCCGQQEDLLTSDPVGPTQTLYVSVNCYQR